MATTQVLLTQMISGLGSEGDEVKVSAGYARNYLVPNGLALSVNHANKKQIEALQNRRAEREAKELDDAKALADQIRKQSIALVVKTGEKGKMFGAVTAQDLISRFEENEISVNKKMFAHFKPIKSLGKHKVELKLHSEITVEFDFEVVSENPIEENN